MVGDRVNVEGIAQHPNAQLAHWASLPEQGSKPFLIFRPALDVPEVVMSYVEVNRRVKLLAQALWQQGVRSGDVVAMALPDGVDHIILMLALWACQAVYMPLPLEVKEHSLASLQAVRPKWLVQAGNKPRWLERLESQPRILSWEGLTHIADADAKGVEPVELGLSALHLTRDAYIFCSSGSTGAPKIIVNTLEGVPGRITSALAIMDVQSIGKPCFLGFFERAFDASLFDLFCALYSGAPVYLMPDAVRMDPISLLPRFVAACEAAQPTVAVLLPTLLAQLQPDSLAHMQRVLTTGEAVRPEQIQPWFAHGKRFYNGYGPTENTIATTITPMLERDESYPLLRPGSDGQLLGILAGVKLWLRTVERREDGVYEYGPAVLLTRETPAFGREQRLELLIGGLGVGRYHTDDSQLRDRFAPNGGSRYFCTRDTVSWNGQELGFTGRLDRQIKREGVLVQLEGVEEHLQALETRAESGIKLISQAVVLALTRRNGSPAMVAFVLKNPDSQLDDALWVARYYECMASWSWRERPDWQLVIAPAAGAAVPEDKTHDLAMLLRQSPRLLQPAEAVSAGINESESAAALRQRWFDIVAPGELAGVVEAKRSEAIKEPVLAASVIPLNAPLDTIGGSSLAKSEFIASLLKHYVEPLQSRNPALATVLEQSLRRAVMANYPLNRLAELLDNYQAYQRINWAQLPAPTDRGGCHYVVVPPMPRFSEGLAIYFDYCEQAAKPARSTPILSSLQPVRRYFQCSARRLRPGVSIWSVLGVSQPEPHEQVSVVIRDVEHLDIPGYISDFLTALPEQEGLAITWYCCVHSLEWVPEAVRESAVVTLVDAVEGQDGVVESKATGPETRPETRPEPRLAEYDYFGDPAPGPTLWQLPPSDRQWVEVLRQASHLQAPPVLVLYPLTGDCPDQYRELLKNIPEQHAVYALLCPEPEDKILANFAAQIAECRRLVLSIAPAGPCVLVGWSYGGLLSHATAASLEQIGYAVAGVINIDFHYPPQALLAHLQGPVMQEKLPEMAGQMVEYFVRRFGGGAFVLADMERKLENADKPADPLAQAQQLFAVAAECYYAYEASVLLERAVKIRRAFLMLALNFSLFAHAQGYDHVLQAPMVLLKAAQSLDAFGYPTLTPEVLIAQWRALAPNVRQVNCPGDHFSLFREARFAELFRDEFNQLIQAEQPWQRWIQQLRMTWVLHHRSEQTFALSILPKNAAAVSAPVPLFNELLANPTVRTICLYGPHGSGKSSAIAAWLEQLPAESPWVVMPLTVPVSGAVTLTEQLLQQGLPRAVIEQLQRNLHVVLVLDGLHPGDETRIADLAEWSRQARLLMVYTRSHAAAMATTAAEPGDASIVECYLQPLPRAVVQEFSGCEPSQATALQLLSNPLLLQWFRQATRGESDPQSIVVNRLTLLQFLTDQMLAQMRALPAWQIPRQAPNQAVFVDEYYVYAQTRAYDRLTQDPALQAQVETDDPLTSYYRSQWVEFAHSPELLAAQHVVALLKNVAALADAASGASVNPRVEQALRYLESARGTEVRELVASLLAKDYQDALLQELPALIGGLLNRWVGGMTLSAAQVTGFLQANPEMAGFVPLLPLLGLFLRGGHIPLAEAQQIARGLPQLAPFLPLLPLVLAILRGEAIPVQQLLPFLAPQLSNVLQQLTPANPADHRPAYHRPADLISWLVVRARSADEVGKAAQNLLLNAISMTLLGSIQATIEDYQSRLNRQVDRLGGWQSLPKGVIEQLQPHFSCDLTQVRYVEGVNTEHGMSTTLGNHIYFRYRHDFVSSASDWSSLFYMLAHVEQFQQQGGIEPFVFRYLVEALWIGYQQLFNTEAVTLQSIGEFISHVHNLMPLEINAERKSEQLQAIPELIETCQALWLSEPSAEAAILDSTVVEEGGVAMPTQAARQQEGNALAHLLLQAGNQVSGRVHDPRAQARLRFLSAVLAETTQAVRLNPAGQTQAGALTERILPLLVSLLPRLNVLSAEFLAAMARPTLTVAGNAVVVGAAAVGAQPVPQVTPAPTAGGGFDMGVD